MFYKLEPRQTPTDIFAETAIFRPSFLQIKRPVVFFASLFIEKRLKSLDIAIIPKTH